MGGLTHWFPPLPRPYTLGYSDERTHPLVPASAPPLHNMSTSMLYSLHVIVHLQQFNLIWHTQCCGSGGPDWFWSAGSGSRRAKKAAHKKDGCAGCSLLKAWDFSYSLAVLHGSLGINVPVWQIFWPKKYKLFHLVNFFIQFLVINSLNPDPH
jgi:hypothetical protein